MSVPIVFDEKKLEKLVTRQELYLVVRAIQNLILAGRYVAASHNIGGPSIVEAMESFQKAETELQVRLNELVRKDEFL